MSAGKRNPSLPDLPRSRGQSAMRVIESPRSIDPTAQISGAGQCLFLLFGDELRAFRQQQQQRAATTPAREVSHV